MATARECARNAVAQRWTRLQYPVDAADVASDIWEPLLRSVRDAYYEDVMAIEFTDNRRWNAAWEAIEEALGE